MIVGNPLPMQYLGSKARISDWILTEIKNFFPSTTCFFDLFSGSGVMAHGAHQAGFNLAANDIQKYSYLILQSLFVLPRRGLLSLAKRVESISESTLLSGGRREAKKYLMKEKAFFNGEISGWHNYKIFCSDTPIINGTAQEVSNLRNANGWNLFWKYYANNYFGVRQTLELDAIAELASNLPPQLSQHLIAATVSAMTFAVSSTTHLAQFLKPSSAINVKNLLARRQYSILNDVAKRLSNVNKYPLPVKKAIILCEECENAIINAPITKKWVVYIDPPYFKEHYSRYYHVLDTFAYYDYPEMTFNKRINKVTVGRYRSARYVSQFGLKAKVKSAFASMFMLLRRKGAKVALSYANTSLVSSETLIRLADAAGYKVTKKKKQLMHSGQGQPRNKNVIEYLFLMK